MLKRIVFHVFVMAFLLLLANPVLAEGLKVHRIFSSNMVLQRQKPIHVWGWADPGSNVTVQLGDEKVEANANGPEGRWEAIFEAREADATPQKLIVRSGDDKIEMDNVVIGDIWVMWGQSNMAWSIGKTLNGDIELAQANLPLLREFRISANEQQDLQKDIPDKVASGWHVSDSKTAGNFSAIGYVFGSRLQRALGIPIGIIDNARGGASIESLVPEHKFNTDDPMIQKYKAHVEQRIADWDIEAWREQAYQHQLARAKSRNVPEDQWPKKESINPRSWNIPGVSPSDMASCYNGMFGVFKGFNIKGVLFHQGYNNAMESNCRPQRYRKLMKLGIEGWREDFNDPEMPVGVIGFCAGSIPQSEENFELWGHSGGAYIREAQRLGVKDIGDPEQVVFLPAYDVQIPGLHPHKKQEHGIRAARWALKNIYDVRGMNWDTASLVSADREGDTMVLTFDKNVMPDDMSLIPEGFSIAGEDGKFYRAFARFPVTKDAGIWSTANKTRNTKQVIVWSPLVSEPVAVRYGWATSPMGNLKVNGKAWLPLASFRTDDWDWPESDDPTAPTRDRAAERADAQEREERLAYRRMEEAKRAVEILERLQTLGQPQAKPSSQ